MVPQRVRIVLRNIEQALHGEEEEVTSPTNPIGAVYNEHVIRPTADNDPNSEPLCIDVLSKWGQYIVSLAYSKQKRTAEIL